MPQQAAELKYQLRQNDDSTDVRFILVADEQAVINADSASLYATIADYGDTDSIVIKRAYRSIKAGGIKEAEDDNGDYDYDYDDEDEDDYDYDDEEDDDEDDYYYDYDDEDDYDY